MEVILLQKQAESGDMHQQIKSKLVQLQVAEHERKKRSIEMLKLLKCILTVIINCNCNSMIHLHVKVLKPYWLNSGYNFIYLVTNKQCII